MGAICGTGVAEAGGNYAVTESRLFGRRDFIAVITNRRVGEDYSIVKDLGEGSFATVKLGVSKRTGVNEVVK